MSEIKWTDAERGVCFGTCGGDVRQHAPHEDQGCAMFEDTLHYLAPFVAERERQAAAKALREAQAAIKAEREHPPIHVLNESQRAAWIIGMNRAHAVVRERAGRVEKATP